MILLHLMKFSVLLFFLVVATFLYQVQASNHGFFSRKKVGISPTIDDGICASSIIVYGYKCQEIQVVTKDGYILSLQRILEGRNKAKNGSMKKQPVILQHGVLVDGMTWLMNSPEQDLPLILADNSFDVWIANTRGTKHSRRHVSLDPSNPVFWNWSWDELVTYDLPAVFDYVYSQTGQKINYVGHSLGTLIALASFSERNLVNQLKSAALLSPIAYLSHMNTALGVVAAKSFVGEITTLIGLAEFNPKGLRIDAFVKLLCDYPRIDCYDLMTELTGKNCCLNSSIIDRFLMNEPQSTSTKNMVHLAQIVRHGVLAKFNYERPDYNIVHYGQVVPPIYNLSNIPHDLPLFISYGGQDALSDVRDVENLLDKLKFHDVDKRSVQFVKEYAHADYIMGFNAKDIVYNSVISFFNSQGNT
ncbi:unnamed protein product [Vicia faba]|uniref:Lipase n=1 Tax=Vicia faba TaxID=3906 RepID=A0AAV0YV94_VICFA|nr:unnamed protein product [Vicia faba]